LGFQFVFNMFGISVLASSPSNFTIVGTTNYLAAVKNFEGWFSIAECLFAPALLDPLLDLLGMEACHASVASTVATVESTVNDRVDGLAAEAAQAAGETAGKAAEDVADQTAGTRTACALVISLLRQGPFASSREDSNLKYTSRDFVKSYVAVYVATYLYACLSFNEHICNGQDNVEVYGVYSDSAARADRLACQRLGAPSPPPQSPGGMSTDGMSSLMTTLWDFAQIDTSAEYIAVVSVNLTCALAICTILCLARRLDAKSKDLNRKALASQEQSTEIVMLKSPASATQNV
jgi:hypothetical protein